MDKMIYIEKRDVYGYSSADDFFSPSKKYPEYFFPEDSISAIENEIYDMVRASLIGLGLDAENYGTDKWNPLGDIIRPGDFVVIKPNMVKDYNDISQYECTLTHPSVIRAVIDYCLIAKPGRLILGDAPIQGANFEKLKRDYHYDTILEFYHKKGVLIEFVDFRDLVVSADKGLIRTLKQVEDSERQYVKVDLGKKSYHYSPGREKRYGINSYVEEKLNENHHGEKHVYAVSRHILEADVIINLPKPKTHRYAGITGAQKNFIGMCSDKESLPHFTKGGPSTGGDETNKDSVWPKIISECNRKYLLDCKQGQYRRAFLWYGLGRLFVKTKRKDTFIEGSWYGNDTIWRTILDLNKVIYYVKKDGTLDFDKMRRKCLVIGDMVVAGQREGPLLPSAKKIGAIVASRNCAVFDYVFCKMAGFHESYIPSVYNGIRDGLLAPNFWKELRLYSNVEAYDKKNIEGVEFPEEYHFEAHPFWKERM